MDSADALSLLERMVANDEDPVLDTDAMTALVGLAARPDSEGNVQTDGTAVWTPTWDLYYAAAEGWRWKASIAASRFNFAEDQQRFDRAQVYAHCSAQAEEYARRGMGSIPVESGTATT